jgi:hypothetical protein
MSVLSTSEMKTAKGMEGDDEALMRGDYESSKNAGAADFIAYTKAYGGTFHINGIVFLFMFVDIIRIRGNCWFRL